MKKILEKLQMNICENYYDQIHSVIVINEITYEEDLFDVVIIYFYNLLNQSSINIDEYRELIKVCAKCFNVNTQLAIDRINWLKKMNLCNVYGIKKNHNLIYEIFDNFNIMLYSENIEHYYTSGILAFLLVNKELQRYHHDIDIFVNFADLKKLEKVCKNYGFVFKKILGDRKDGTKRRILKMYYKDYLLPITVFMYVRNLDGSIIQKDYYYSNDILMVEDIYNSAQCAKLSFSNQTYFHNNIPYNSISLEALYLCKDGARSKDIYDCSIMHSEVDIKKLEELKKEILNNKPNISYVETNPEIIEFMSDVCVMKRELKNDQD